MDRVRRVVVPIFRGDEKSYPFWRKRMEHYLKQEDLFYVLEKRPEEEDFANPVAGATAAQETDRKTKVTKRLKDARVAINDLFMGLDDDPMAHVFECNTAKDIIDKLDEIFQPKGPVAMLGLRSRLYLLRNEKFESIQKLFSSHEEIVRQLTSMGEKVPHEEQINSLLVAIPTQYKHLLGALSILRREELNNMTMEQIKRIFIDAHSSSSKLDSEVNAVAYVNRQPKPHQQEKKKKEFNMRNCVCFECGAKGHKKQNCFMIKRRKQEEKESLEAEKQALRAEVAMVAGMRQDQPNPQHLLVKRDNGRIVVKLPVDRINLSRVGKIRHESGHPWSQPLKDAISDQYVR